MTEAHKTGYLSELVCSNSLKAKDPMNAHGLLKEELKIMGSLILEVAEEAALPGGKALVVDREEFAKKVTERIEENPLIEVIREEVKEIPKDRIVILATGPLTSKALTDRIVELTGEGTLSFYDAISPIVDAESLDFTKLYRKDRHGLEEEAYLNAPMTKEEYEAFVKALVEAEVHEPHDFEKDIPYFEACLPIEVMAKRGIDTLRYGPLRPIGLEIGGKEPYAVVQLRPENREETAFSLVGFQTQLKIGEQKKVFRMIPGLEKAEFLRYGSVHRNTFLNAPRVLERTLQLRKAPNVFVAGQLVGTEGYVEAAMGGLLAGINAERLLKGKPLLVPPRETMMGALINYLVTANPRHFQPMNANFGLLSAPRHLRGRAKRRFFVERSLHIIREWIDSQSLRTS
jgi:methylenetetrahydrofolate--tRNA-(uracil-5-)-methyltransferase